MVVSKPFDNVSVLDGISPADDAPNFGGISQQHNAGIDLVGLGGNNNYNISSNHNLLGQYSMPAPVMGLGGGLGYSSVGGMGNFNFLTGTTGLDFTSSMAGTSKIINNSRK